jgi:hypothetical protein
MGGHLPVVGGQTLSNHRSERVQFLGLQFLYRGLFLLDRAHHDECALQFLGGINPGHSS